MPYATQADLVTRFGSDELIQLTDRAGTNAIDASIVAAALADADAAIEGYLAGRYALPVTPVPALLKRIGADLARFFLHGKAATESVRNAYQDALKLLRDLSNGAAVLAGAAAAPSGATPATDSDGARFVTPDRVLSRGQIADYLG